jgi:hypothetical protein
MKLTDEQIKKLIDAEDPLLPGELRAILTHVLPQDTSGPRQRETVRVVREADGVLELDQIPGALDRD